jgi:hypothetical protein
VTIHPRPLSRTVDRAAERRRRTRRRLGLAALIVVIFALGVALGQALHDNPKPGGTVTLERTLSIPSGPLGSTFTP